MMIGSCSGDYAVSAGQENFKQFAKALVGRALDRRTSQMQNSFLSLGRQPNAIPAQTELPIRQMRRVPIL